MLLPCHEKYRANYITSIYNADTLHCLNNKKNNVEVLKFWPCCLEALKGSYEWPKKAPEIDQSIGFE